MLKRGFTLLEVMVAIALLAVGLVLLLQVQARSIQIAQQARNMSVATGLARAKLYDCTQDLLKKGFSIGDYDEAGDFEDDGFESFFWECHGYKPKLPVPDATEMAAGMTEGAAATGIDGAGGAAGAADAAGIGAGMIAPVLAQMSTVIGESIRELTIIVRWKEGEEFEEMRVVTHVIDKSQINAIAGAISQQAGAFNPLGMMGGGGAGGASGDPGGRTAPPGSTGTDAPGLSPSRGGGK